MKKYLWMVTITLVMILTGCSKDHADLEEAAKREAKWREAGYHIISMRNDFRTIYGAGVEKVDFYFPSDGE